MSRPQRLSAVLPMLLTGLFLSACVQVPSADPEIDRALASADANGRVGLLRQQGEAITGVPFVAGNEVTLLRNGAEAYPALLKLIAGARHQIEMESYEFEADQIPRLTELLIARRAAGVDVALIYDAWGSNADPKVFDRLRQAGVKVLEFHPIDPLPETLGTFDHRDHRKLLVVDGRIVVTGGINLSNVYQRQLTSFPALGNTDHLPWRDTDVEIEGPVASQFDALFRQNWNAQKGRPIAPPLPPPSPWPDGLSVQALGAAPTRDRPIIYKTLLVTIALARHSIHLTTGFFVPTPDLARELKRATRRGVEVAIIVPSRSDSKASIDAGRTYYGGLMAAGVRIYEYQNAVLHAKTAVIDGDWSTVGSSNLDWRSAALNDEINAVILGHGFAAVMEEMFRDDLTHARQIDPDAWSRRPLGEKLEGWGARLFQDFL